MRFDFWTLGGGYFWEDVFFYQKWRIQRHCVSKKYRLLDNWDIRRFEGSFEDCKNAFIKNIDIYELSRQKGPMVIMLHGLFDTKNIFKPLWRALLPLGFSAAAINYPSTVKGLQSHAKQIDFLMNNLEDIKEVCFVTKGAGNLVLRRLLSKKSGWQNKIKIDKIVCVSPVLPDNTIFAKLAEFGFFRWLLGPMLLEMVPQNLSNTPEFAKELNVGTVHCQNFVEVGLEYLEPLLKLGKWRKNYNAKHAVWVKNFRFNVFNNWQVVEHITHFLTDGYFKKM